MANNGNYRLNQGDFISSLPNDVLLNILSKLNTTEQARTSILSSRWTNLWTSNTCLNIDAADFMKRNERKSRIFSFGSTTFSSVVALTLKDVSLSSEIVHNLLSNSPNLLELSLIESVGDLVHLSISGSSLKLKHLELKGNSISFLEISAPNLVSFSFSTRMDWPSWPVTRFSNIPLLIRLSCPLGLILHAWREFYALLPQLVTLTLTVSKDSTIRDIDNFPVLSNLKQMHVRLLSDYDEGGLLHWLSRLFKASPYLCRLSFDLGIHVPKHNLIENFPSHEFIEEIEILNIKGSEREVQPLISIIMSCSSLRKITIQSSSYERKVYQNSVESAVKELAAKLPQQELKIVFKARNGPNTNKF